MACVPDLVVSVTDRTETLTFKSWRGRSAMSAFGGNSRLLRILKLVISEDASRMSLRRHNGPEALLLLGRGA